MKTKFILLIMLVAFISSVTMVYATDYDPQPNPAYDEPKEELYPLFSVYLLVGILAVWVVINVIRDEAKKREFVYGNIVHVNKAEVISRLLEARKNTMDAIAKDEEEEENTE